MIQVIISNSSKLFLARPEIKNTVDEDQNINGKDKDLPKKVKEENLKM